MEDDGGDHAADYPEIDAEDSSFHQNWTPTHRPWRDMYRAWRGEGPKRDGLLLQTIDEFPEMISPFTSLVLFHLDFASIVRLSRTCRCLRHLGQDPSTWRMLCCLTWGNDCKPQMAEYGGTWRNMFVRRPRPRTDGCYVHKWNTVKYGTNEGRGIKEAGKDWYQPVAIICMVRILLFRHGRKVAMVTTNSNNLPPDTLGKALRKFGAGVFRRGRAKPAQSKVLGTVPVGTFEMVGDALYSSWEYVPPEFPLMQPLVVDYVHRVESSVPGRNEALRTLAHTTGKKEGGAQTFQPTSERPYVFLPLDESFGERFSEIEGWPDCNIDGLGVPDKRPQRDPASLVEGAAAGVAVPCQ